MTSVTLRAQALFDQSSAALGSFLQWVRSPTFRHFFAEYVIVALGATTGFLFDEYRETRGMHKREDRYLARLASDLQESTRNLESGVRGLDSDLEEVEHVWKSLLVGKILGGDTVRFERGLAHADVLPAIVNPVPTYEELRSTGAFAEIQDERLKDLLSTLRAQYEYAREQLPYYRAGLSEVRQAVESKVEFRLPLSEIKGSRLENVQEHVRARFSFESLAADKQLVNKFAEAVDTHQDWIFLVKQISECARMVKEHLDVMKGIKFDASTDEKQQKPCPSGY
jgi:hypothetical protein